MTVGVNILSCSQTHKLATFYAAASVMDPGQAPAPIYLLIIGLDDLKRERMRGASRFDTKCRRRRTFAGGMLDSAHGQREGRQSVWACVQ